MTRRATLKGFVALAAVEKLTDGGLAAVSLPGRPERHGRVLPPGALEREAFARKCVGCQACVRVCPGECLRFSRQLRSFGQIELDFLRGYCLIECGFRCARVCPTGAISQMKGLERRHVHLGAASWHPERCLRHREGIACTACQRKCPVGAIRLVSVEGAPAVLSVDADRCVGCGACEHVCPSRPEPAIVVNGFERQRVVAPMAVADLWAEMRRVVDGGASAVVARDGVIVAEERGRGVEPLLRLLDGRRLGPGSLVFDRAIGRAAAAICLVGQVREVRALVMGEDAAELLRRYDVACSAERMVDRVLNRDRTADCPLERKVADCDDPAEMVKRLR